MIIGERDDQEIGPTRPIHFPENLWSEVTSSLSFELVTNIEPIFILRVSYTRKGSLQHKISCNTETKTYPGNVYTNFSYFYVSNLHLRYFPRANGLSVILLGDSNVCIEVNERVYVV